MKEFLETYNHNQEDIEYFLQESIKNLGNLSLYEGNNFKHLYNLFPSLELVYVVDKNSKEQVSNNIGRYKNDPIGKEKIDLT